MGKFRDWCLETGETHSAWLARDNQPKSSGLKGKLINLPKPYHQRVTGQTEAPILKALIEGLNAAGIWCSRLEASGKLIHTKGGMRMVPSAMVGLPDVLACLKGRLIALEAKAPGGHLSAAQHAKLLELNHAGALVMIVVSPEKALSALLHGTDATCVLDSGLQVY